MKAEEYYKKVEDIGKRIIQDDITYVSLAYCSKLMEEYAQSENEGLKLQMKALQDSVNELIEENQSLKAQLKEAKEEIADLTDYLANGI